MTGSFKESPDKPTCNYTVCSNKKHTLGMFATTRQREMAIRLVGADVGRGEWKIHKPCCTAYWGSYSGVTKVQSK